MANNGLIGRVARHIAEWCVLPSESFYTVAAAFAVMTWISDYLEAVPYLALQALPGSGKSTTLETIADLTCLVPSKPSESSFRNIPSILRMLSRAKTDLDAATGRTIHGTATLVIDQCEVLSGTGAGLAGTLCTAYQRGKGTHIANGEAIPVWAPVMFGGNYTLRADIRSRTIEIRMERATIRPERKRAYPWVVAEYRDHVRQLRGDIYHATHALQAHGMPRIALPDVFTNDRDVEQWYPLYAVCALFGTAADADALTVAYRESQANRSLDAVVPVGRVAAQVSAVPRDERAELHAAVRELLDTHEGWMPTGDLLAALAPRFPLLTPESLAMGLAPYGLAPMQRKIKGRVLRGYRVTR